MARKTLIQQIEEMQRDRSLLKAADPSSNVREEEMPQRDPFKEIRKDVADAVKKLKGK
jgi:hypothetical protein